MHVITGVGYKSSTPLKEIALGAKSNTRNNYHPGVVYQATHGGAS